MGFLGSIGSYITPAVQAGGAVQEGKHRGLLEKIKLDRQAKDDAIKAIISGATVNHLNAETDHLKNPEPKGFHFDQDGNAYTMLPNGHLQRAVIDPAGEPAGPSATTPPEATGGPPGDIDLSAPPGIAQPAAAAPAAQQGTPKAPPTPQPKFGPKKEASTIPGTPEWKAAKIAEAKIGAQFGYHPPVEPQIVSATSPNPDGSPGQPKFFRVPKAAGDAQEIGGIVPAPKVGALASGNAEQTKKAEQFGLGLNSLGDVISSMEQRNFKAPNMVTGPLTAEARTRGSLGELAQGGLNMMDPGLADLSGSSNLFMSAAAHSVGGARITPEQIAMFTSGYTARTNDPPELVKKKLIRSVDFLNAAAAVLPPEMVQKQLASLSPGTLNLLKKYGFGRAPSPEGRNAVQQIQEAAGGSSGDITSSAPQTKAQQVQAIKSGAKPKKRTAAEILAQHNISP